MSSLLVCRPKRLILRYFKLCEQNFMCFDALKSGVVSKRLVNETTWNKQRRRKRTHNTKKSFWKTNLTMRTFNKATETT
ncbi:hypothetical protein FV768_25175 [Vibrio parahaemolyticus]|nr:hypothetical protein [Vibrio parahaemolyticus]EGQ8185539.1 hypothetical protein [Vibrio parahaemolyticus]EGQ9819192.1 hypothetical protein [Vibrio parahaemolyticus]MQC67309.1 hypothetical protein [Vibrio parahaemolyticus]MQC87551.1 hypothetical protein [Vibrio parahaemolyticus]